MAKPMTSNWETFQPSFHWSLKEARRASRGWCIQPPRADKVNNTLTTQERLLGLPDDSVTTQGQAGRTRRSGKLLQRYGPTGVTQGSQTLELRPKNKQHVAVEDQDVSRPRSQRRKNTGFGSRGSGAMGPPASVSAAAQPAS